MKKLPWRLKYHLKWYLDHHLMKNKESGEAKESKEAKESTEQYKEIIEILKTILCEAKDPKTADSKTALDSVITIDAKSIQEAISRLVQLAERGNVQSVEATYLLGVIYLNGIGVDQDMKRAVEYLQIAVKSEHAPALSALGGCYELGNGVEKDLPKAFHFYASSSRHEWAPAYFSLAQFYELGKVVVKDFEYAAKYSRFAANQGYAPAEDNLGNYYSDGSGVPKDLWRAFEFYRSAASKGCCNSQAMLGSYYLNGTVVSKNIEEAIRNIKLAVLEGHTDAQLNLSYCYSHDVGVGLDLKRHVEFSTLSATKGCGSALYNLGMSYLVGDGVTPDSLRAVLSFFSAVEKVESRQADWIDWLRGVAKQNEKFSAEIDVIFKISEEIDTKIEDIDSIEEKYIEFFPYVAFMYQLEGNLKDAEKLYSKALEYYTKKMELQPEARDLHIINRLHWDLYFCYQSQKQNYVDVEFDTILTAFYEKLRYSVNKGNYHDLELLAYMNEQSETNLEGNWNAAVQFYHQLLNQLEKETGVKDSPFVDYSPSQTEERRLAHPVTLSKVKTKDVLTKWIDVRNSSQQMFKGSLRKIEHAHVKLNRFKPLLQLRDEIEVATGVNSDLAALVVSYAMDTDVQQKSVCK